MRTKLLIFTVLIFFSCGNNQKDSCKNGCKEAIREAIEQGAFYDLKGEEVIIAKNIDKKGNYLDPEKVEEDIIFNIDGRNKSYQIVHIGACSQRTFYISGQFLGKLPSQSSSRKYLDLDTVKLVMKNIFSINGKLLRMLDARKTTKQENPKAVELDVLLVELEGDLPMASYTNVVLGKKGLKRNTPFSLHLKLGDWDTKFDDCQVPSPEISPKDYNVGGHSCNGSISY